MRHVAIVTLRLVEPASGGEGEPSPLSDEQRRALVRALERSRAMLGDMAYKRGMRWVWTSDLEARAIAGLGPKPAKAASDAAWLARRHPRGDRRHQGGPARRRSARRSSIVRGIASGARDPEGNLVRYVLHDPVDVPRRRARARDAAAGHVGGGRRLSPRAPRFSLGRRADARSQDRRRRPGARAEPAAARCASTRSSARSRARRRPPEQANAQNDLVGRDAEKAELHGAYHAAVNGPGGGIVSSPRDRRRARHRQDRARRDVPRRAPAERAPRARRVLARAHGGAVQRARRSRARRHRRERRRVVRRDRASHRARRRRLRAARHHEPDGGAPRGDRREPDRRARRAEPQGEDEDAHYRKKSSSAGVRHLVAAHRARAAARRRHRGPAVGGQAEPRARRRAPEDAGSAARPRSCSSRAPTIASRRSSRAWCASSSTGSRATSRSASSRRASRCATACARSAPSSCRASAATRSSCSRWSTRCSSAACSRSATTRWCVRTAPMRDSMGAAVDARAAPRRSHPRAARAGARRRRLARHRGRSARPRGSREAQRARRAASQRRPDPSAPTS